MAFFVVLIFVLVEIKSWALSGTHYVVVGPLVRNREVDEASKEIFAEPVGGGRLTGENRVRAVPSKTKAFDSTMGFPGEDVVKQRQS